MNSIKTKKGRVISSRFFLTLVICLGFQISYGEKITLLTQDEKLLLDSIQGRESVDAALIIVGINPDDCINCNSVLYNINKQIGGRYVLYLVNYSASKTEIFRRRYDIHRDVKIYTSKPVLTELLAKCFPKPGERSGIIYYDNSTRTYSSTFREYNGSASGGILSVFEPVFTTELKADDFFYYRISGLLNKIEGELFVCSFEPDANLALISADYSVQKTLSLDFDFLDSNFIRPYYAQLPDSLMAFNYADSCENIYEKYLKGMGIQLVSTHKVVRLNDSEFFAFGHVLIPYLKDGGERVTFEGKGLILKVSMRDLGVTDVFSYNFDIDKFYAPFDDHGVFISESKRGNNQKNRLQIGLISYNDTLFQNEFLSSIWEVENGKYHFVSMDSVMLVDTSVFRGNDIYKYQSLSHFQIDDDHIGFNREPILFNSISSKYTVLSVGVDSFDFYQNYITRVRVKNDIRFYESVENYDGLVFYTIRTEDGVIQKRSTLSKLNSGLQRVYIDDKKLYLFFNPNQGTTEIREFVNPFNY